MRDAHRIREQVNNSLEDHRAIWITGAVLALLGGAFGGGFAIGRRAERLEGERMVADVQPPSELASGANSNQLTFYSDLTKFAQEAEPQPTNEDAAVAPKAAADKALADKMPSDKALADKAPFKDKAPAGKVAQNDARPSFLVPADRATGTITDALSRGPAQPGDYTVQVSSFQTKQEAHAFASALERKGFKPFVVSSDLPGKGTWHRVRIGRFESEDQARAAKGMLAKSDMPAWVLRSD